MAAAKIAVLLAVVALFATAGAAEPQPLKGAHCRRCYSSCMNKCDGYRDAAVRSANRTQPAVHTTVDDGAAAASIPVNSTDGTAAIVPSTDGAVAHIADGYQDKDDDDKDGDDDDKNNKGDDDDDDDDYDDDDDDKNNDDDNDNEDDDDDDDDDNDDNDDWKKYFRRKKSCIVDCYKRLPAVCYKMCISESCLNMPPYKRAHCYKSCGHKCLHNHPSPGPKPKPKPKPPKPKPTPTPPKPTPPKPAPPKPMPPPSPTPPKPMPPPSPMLPKPTPPKPLPKRPCPPNAPKIKTKPKHLRSPKTKPKLKPPCPPSATVSASTNTSYN